MAEHTWQEVETRVRGRIMVRVSGRIGERDGTHLYSMRVGTTQLRPDGTTQISSHMSIHDIEDARALLKEMRDKYWDEQAKERETLGLAGRYRKVGSNK